MTMKNSKLDPAWVARAVANNPITPQANGEFVSCPLRLSLVHVMAPNPKPLNANRKPDGPNPLYEITALFPPGGQEQLNSIVWPTVYQKLRMAYPHAFDAAGNMVGQLHLPWELQDKRAANPKYAGYTPGLPCARMTSQYKPQVVDPAKNPIVDPARIYPGVWAIVGFNFYTYDPQQPIKGGSFGIQSIMLIADDTRLAGGGPDVNKTFANVNVDAKFDAAAAFAANRNGPPPPGSAIMPPPQTVGAPPPPPSYGAPPAVPPGWPTPPAPTAETQEQMMRRLGLG